MESRNEKGIHFVLRYVGCISINVSMKTLDYSVRSDLTKECVTRVCEAAHMITERKRKVPKQIRDCLPGTSNLENGGENVYLTISTRNFVVSCMNNLEVRILFEHPIADISFALAGDNDTSDFVAYVGKDERNGRRCYVFECQAGNTPEVISTIKHAFETRFEQVTSTPVVTINAPGVHQNSTQANSAGGNGVNQNSAISGSIPNTTVRFNQAPEPLPRVTLASSPRSPVLIDLNSPTQPTVGTSYVNTPEHFFDEPVVVPPLPCLKNLQTEPWFHGRMSREDSEALLRNDGEFLVRVSAKDPTQVVLTGVQNGVHKHLMLIDEEGKVRTKDREFESVSHLINHHRSSNLPITSAESALVLRYPVNRVN